MRRLSFFRGRFLFLVLLAAFFAVSGPALHAKAAKALDLHDTVAANRILTKFALIIQNSGLATFLSSRGPFTLFAPTDSAFSKLPPGTLDSLLRPENQDVLQRILLFHVVNGKRLTAKDLLPLKTLLSCEGSPLTIHTNRSGTQLVMKAKILHADIRCANGLIHEIDTVLLPPGIKFPLPEPPPAPPSTHAAPATNAAPAPPESTNAPTEVQSSATPAASPE